MNTLYNSKIKSKASGNQGLKNRLMHYLIMIRLSLSGTDQDFTTLKLRTAIFLLSVPMVLEMIMESVFAIADIFFVSRLGADAVAVVGLTESMMTIVYAIGFGLSMGTTALVARRTGEKNQDLAKTSAVQAIIAGAGVSLLIAVPGFLFSDKLLLLMGASAETVLKYSSFTKIMFGGNMVIILLFIINAIFRSAGDAALSMRVLLMANLINIILDPILIFGFGPIPALGIMGAAIATNIGRGIAVLYQFYILFYGSGRISLKLSDFRFDFRLLGSLLKLSLGGIGQNLIATSSWIGMVRIVSVFGSEAVAGYTIAIRIIVFSLLPSWGISNAAATLVGQNLGAGRPDRAARSIRITGIVNMLLLGMISLLFIFMPEMFIKLFISDPIVIQHGVVCLRIVSFGLAFYGLGMVMTQSLNGAGDTFTPTLLNLICFWMIEIPLAYYLAIYSGYNAEGVYYAVVIAESFLSLLGLAMISRGRWKLKTV
jgi:putative MATE family efflux protein